MKQIEGIGLPQVQSVYGGPEADLWELVMGQQIHVGGMQSSRALAAAAGIRPGWRGVDLCCCTGAGMRFLVRFCGAAQMTGVDATPRMIERGRRRNQEEGVGDKIEFVLGDASATKLPDGLADFVWGEDAWCYVLDKRALVREAVRLVRGGGIIAFTDWMQGPTPMSDSEAGRLLRFMKFPNILAMSDYVDLFHANQCEIEAAEDTQRFPAAIDLYLAMLDQQLSYDALKIIGFDADLMQTLAGEMQFMQGLVRQRKLIQGMVAARKR
jgi:ubiquinone/menaquinone biosynthesis C-methylase UbiE